jgi:hypothetical protein
MATTIARSPHGGGPQARSGGRRQSAPGQRVHPNGRSRSPRPVTARRQRAAQFLSRAADDRQSARIYMNAAHDELRRGRADEALELLDRATSAGVRRPIPDSTMFLGGQRRAGKPLLRSNRRRRAGIRAPAETLPRPQVSIRTDEGLAGSGDRCYLPFCSPASAASTCRQNVTASLARWASSTRPRACQATTRCS